MNEVQNPEVEQPIQDAQPEPKLLPQHEVNALIGGAKQKGFEKGYQQAKAELMAQQQPIPPIPDNSQAMYQMNNEDRLRQIASEELSKARAVEEANWLAKQQEAAGMKILNELKMKTEAAKSKYEDYEKVVKSDFENFAKTHEVLSLANNFDNAGEMLYDLGKNPANMAQISLMVRMGMKDEAFSQMKRLSDSIKVNEMSASQPKPKMPLSQIQPSTVGVGKVDEDSYSKHFKGNY